MRVPKSIVICPPGGYRYTEPETGISFKTTGINALYAKVFTHRAANNLDISIGWQDRLHEELCEQMESLPCEEVQRPEDHPMVKAGRKHWAELHEYASEYPVSPTPEQMASAAVWMEDWRRRIPQYGCSCRKKFEAIEAVRPLDLSSQPAFYIWTVEVHSDVSEKLGKPRWDGS